MATPRRIGYASEPMDSSPEIPRASRARAWLSTRLSAFEAGQTSPLAYVVVLASVVIWLYKLVFIDRSLRIDADGRVGVVFDDAYMFVRYADHVLGGWGVAWNAGEAPVHGNTSALYLAELIAIRSVFHGDPGHVAVVGSLVGAVAALVAAVHLVRSIGRTMGCEVSTWSWAALVVPTLLAAPTFRYHAVTGMDTTLAFTLIAATIAASARLVDDRPRVDSAIACGLLGWLSIEARPDNGILALGVPLGLAWAAGRLRQGSIAFGTSIAAAALSTAAKFAYFGDPMPLAAAAKRAGFYGDYLAGWRWNPVAYLLEVGLWLSPWLVLGLLGASRSRGRWYAALIVPLSMTWATLFGVVQIMGFHARYYVPGSAVLLAAATIGAVDLLRTRAVSPLGLVGPGALVGLLLGAQPIAAAYERVALTRETPRPERYYAQPKPLPTRRINPSTQAIIRVLQRANDASKPGREASPDNAKVSLAATEYGLIGATLPMVPILDLAGLHDPVLAHGGGVVDRLIQVKPTLIWMPFPDYDGMTRALYCDRRLWDEYEVVPGAFRFGVAIRRDAEASTRAALNEEFSRFYAGETMDDHLATPRAEGCR